MGDNSTHPDQKYVDALLNNNHKGIAEIYTLFAPKVIGYVKKNSGDDARAQDIVQEGILTIYDQAKTKGLQLTCPFDAYFFLICKRKWLNVLKKSSPEGVTINEEITSIDAQIQFQADETSMFDAQSTLFNEMLASMGEKCRELIKLTFTIKSMEMVAEKLGVSYAYARKKKSLCVGKLTEMVRGSRQYQILKNL
ncbi:MAG: RNA polymerase sigma factor (sigma-70 family) [Flavobacteriales bacterium]|jgi:RNA polymerase sigma factor (sigma-70 family)